MLNRTSQAHNYLSLLLMTIVGWHRNCNLHQSFSVIPSWHCPYCCLLGVSSFHPLLGVTRWCAILWTQPTTAALSYIYLFTTSLNGFIPQPLDGHASLWVRAVQGPSGREWPQQSPPLKRSHWVTIVIIENIIHKYIYKCSVLILNIFRY